MKLKLILGALISLSFLAGCSGHPSVAPQFADLKTPHVTITAKDGSWSFSSGKPFTPPIISDLSKHEALKASYVQRDLTAYNNPRFKGSVMDVVIDVRGGEKLDGKIIFTNVYEKAASASAKRKWTVSVPEAYLNIARQGNVAVLYQPYKYNSQDWASWVLWMSSLPL